MILGIQLVGILFGLVILYITHLHYKRKEFKKTTYYVWVGIWIIFLIMVIFPGILSPITKGLKFNRTMDLLTVSGFMFLVVLTYNNYITIHKQNRKIEKLVRKIAINQKK